MSTLQTTFIQKLGAGTDAFEIPANDGTSGQYLQTDGTGGLSWQTLPTSILSSGVQSGDGGSGSGTITVDSFTGLDFSAATANSRLMVMARTCMQESTNTSNIAFIEVMMDVGGSNQIQLCCARMGATNGIQSGAFQLEISTNTIQALTATYRTTNINLLFRAELDSGGGFNYGALGTYNGEGAGYNFSYVLFSE